VVNVFPYRVELSSVIRAGQYLLEGKNLKRVHHKEFIQKEFIFKSALENI